MLLTPNCMPWSEAQLTPMLRMSRSVTSTNFDSIITWSVALSSCSMMERMRPIWDGRSVITRALLRPSITILPPRGGVDQAVDRGLDVGRLRVVEDEDLGRAGLLLQELVADDLDDVAFLQVGVADRGEHDGEDLLPGDVAQLDGGLAGQRVGHHEVELEEVGHVAEDGLDVLVGEVDREGCPCRG